MKRRQARAGIGLGLDIDLGHAKGDQPLQLLDPLGDCGRLGEGEPGLEGGERLLLLVVAVVVAGDQKQRVAAFDRVGRFDIGVVGAAWRGRRRVGEQRLREAQPDEPVIGAVGDRRV